MLVLSNTGGRDVANTLGLDDDLDSVELVKNIEEAFDIEIGNEAEQVFAVGELYDLVRRKIPVNDTDKKCASAMTFYRLRQGLGRMGYKARLSPAADIRFLERGGTKTNIRKLESETGLRLPRSDLTTTALVGCLAPVLLPVIWIAVSRVFPDYPVPNWLIYGLMAFPVYWGAILFLDPGRLPKDATTLGGLSRKTAALNYGKLIREGASRSDNQLWENLVELLSDYALPKSEITRETVFLQSQIKKSAAA
jgi:hypothetical protein